MDIDKDAMLKAIEIANRIGGDSVHVYASTYSGQPSVNVYGKDAVDRVLPLVKRIARKAAPCSCTISGEAELDGIKIEIPNIAEERQEPEELDDLVFEGG